MSRNESRLLPVLARRIALLWLCTGAVSGAAAAPNVVVVLVDDLRWDEIGVAGHPYVETPNIDQLAEGGAYFRNAFTVAPLCSPSRAAFLTGQYIHTNGIYDNLARSIQSHRLETFPKHLDDRYDTAFIGKWHMGNDDSPRPGFDHWAGMRGQGAAIDPEFNIDGERSVVEGYVTDILTDMATAFIQRERDEPFLLYLSHKALHPNITQLDDGSSTAAPSGPPGFVAAPRHRGRYAGREPPRRPNYGVVPQDKPALMRTFDGVTPLGPDSLTPDETIIERQEMLLAVDDGVGAIVAALEALDQLDDTLVVFTSDHGYWYGEHALGAERRMAYEEGIRIPMILHYPARIEAGAVHDEMVISLDLAPTVIEYAEAGDDGLRLHGRSLVPLLDGQADVWRDSFLIEYYSDTVFGRMRNMGYQAVRTRHHKYIRYTALSGMDELYDLQEDPHEMRNLANEPEREQLLDDMQAELNRLLFVMR
ncbi:MAG: sulfatase-like hydrolase/transferase [Woeseiaceae bacterium]|nr:sulfatase-like hydrolase/transferase [Woeseiaceae bacterium]